MTPTEAPEEIDEQQQADDSEPYGPNNKDLPEQLVNLIAGTIKEFSKQDTYLRRREVMRDRKARFYERGYQHLCWSGTGQSGGFALVTPGLQMPGSSAQAPQYVDDYNIFWPYERIVLSILTQNLPGVDFQPKDPDRIEDIEAAKTAECYSGYFDRTNNVKSIQWQSLRMMMLGGRSISWTRTEADAEKFGRDADGNPKQFETTTIYGTLESRVPIMAKEQKDALFCFLYDDPQVKKAKDDYPDFADKIQGNQAGLGENQYERLARLGALQGSRQPMATGESFSYLTTRMNCWLRPAAFTGTDYDALFTEDSGAESMTCGEKLRQIFPDGGRFTFVGETYVGSCAESMDDHICISFAAEGDGMFRQAPMDCMVVNQDAFNDAMNAARLLWDVGWPSRWVTADQTEFDTIVGQVATPYASRLKKSAPGMKAQDFFFQEPNPELPATFVTYLEFIQGALPQFQTATPPALWGAQMEDQKTAHGYAQAQQSAMGQLGLLWSSLQHQFARIRYQSALCAASNPDHAKEIVIPGGNGQNTTMQLANIKKDRFGAYPDEDSSFPETTAAKRGTMERVMEMLVQAQSPVAAEIMASPDNVAEFLRVEGLAELEIPQAEARDAQQFEIEELIKTSPMVSPMALQAAQEQHAAQVIAGQPAEPFDPESVAPDQPSVDINDWDYHQFHAAKCQDWLNGSQCRQQLARGNRAGILNVDLHRKKHLAALAAMMPPPMPPAPRPAIAPHPAPPPVPAAAPPALM